MREEIALSISTVSSDLMFDYCRPNDTILQKALNFNASLLDSLEDSDLSKFIIALGQYLVYLKYKENECSIKKIELNKQYEYECFKKIFEVKWKTNTPVKEKMRFVSSNDLELKALEKEKDIAESEYAILEGMYGAFLEYLNAYKKEQGRRLFRNGFDAKERL